MTSVKDIIADAERIVSTTPTSSIPYDRLIAINNVLLARLIQMLERDYGDVDNAE
jgi:hypothetical protein